VRDPFLEAKEALDVAERQYSSVGSLNVMAANATNQACENSLRALYQIATGQSFPHQDFKPFHKPEVIADKLGVKGFHSEQSQAFLKKIDGLRFR